MAHALAIFREQRRQSRSTASHNQKRSWVGLSFVAQRCHTLTNLRFSNQALKLGLFSPQDDRPKFAQWLTRTGIHIVVRPPFKEGIPARRTILYDYQPLAPPSSSYAVINEANGYYEVPIDRSTVFVQEVIKSMFFLEYTLA